MIVSEEEEFAIGQKVDKQVREELGVYLELPKLRSFVKRAGEQLGRQSDRPDLIYRIEVVDAPGFNAFAVPGGFLYVNRGLIERMNSADDLVSVLGHEIAHVAARHSAALISKARLMNVALLGLTVATKGAVRDYGQLINIGSALAFNKFTRDDEREADYFGTRYMARAGYNPKASIDVMKQIQRLQIRKPSELQVWFMTHPPAAERILNLNEAIKEMRGKQPEVLERRLRRNEYVALLDGLAVGEWNGNELIRGNRYYNKEFLLSLEIPKGWIARIRSKNNAAVFIQPRKDFFAFFDIEPLRTRKTTAEYFGDFDKRLRRAGLKKVADAKSDETLRTGALIGTYRGSDRNKGSILAKASALVSGTHGFSFLGFSKANDFEKFQPEAKSIFESLRFISEKEAAELKPPRLRIHKVARGETWSRITRKYFNSTTGVEKLAEYNGFEVSQNPPPGILLKIPPSLRFL